MADQAPSFRTLIASFTDFLTVAIHAILYERAIYPSSSFQSVRKYNLAVRQNRHPRVCEWITDAVAALESELVKGSVDRLALVLYSRQNQPLERFVFDLNRFPSVPAAQIDQPLQYELPDASKQSALPMDDLEEHFRAALSRLISSPSSLRPLPPGCTFTLAIELKRDSGAPVSHPQPWLPAEPQHDPAVVAKGTASRTTPLRTVAAGAMMFEIWIEQIGEDEEASNQALEDAG